MNSGLRGNGTAPAHMIGRMASAGEGRHGRPMSVIGLAAWTVLIAAAHVWGRQIVADMPATRIFTPPLVARYAPSIGLRVLVPVAVAAVIVGFAYRLGAAPEWRTLLLLAFAAAAVWTLSLALTDGLDGVTRPLHFPNDYRHDIDLVGSPGDFLAHFTERIDRYNQHVRAHPPGMVLLLWLMDGLRLGGAGWEAALIIAGGAATVPAAMVALREVAGESPARAATPFLALAPAAIWVASTADALFAGVGAWAVALLVVSTGRAGSTSALLAVLGGLLFGAGLFLSYGLAPLILVPVAVALVRRRPWPLLLATAGALLVVGLFATAGFWWPDGLATTIGEYRESAARLRPHSYFWLGNLAAFALAVGPATAVGLARLRDRRAWLLVAGGLVAVALANASGLSKGEVERIWLPYVPWVMVATGALPPRAWLALNAAFAILVEAALNTTW